MDGSMRITIEFEHGEHVLGDLHTVVESVREHCAGEVEYYRCKDCGAAEEMMAHERVADTFKALSTAHYFLARVISK